MNPLKRIVCFFKGHTNDYEIKYSFIKDATIITQTLTCNNCGKQITKTEKT